MQYTDVEELLNVADPGLMLGRIYVPTEDFMDSLEHRLNIDQTLRETEVSDQVRTQCTAELIAAQRRGWKL